MNRNARMVRMRSGSCDPVTFEKVFVWQEYAFNYLEKAYVIIDCGSNVGFAAIWFALRFPNATIIALEPEDDNFRNLLKNTEAFPNLLPIHCGLWSRECRLVNVNQSKRVDSYQFRESCNEVSGVCGTDFDSILNRFSLRKVDILKIDIEGAEAAVFTKECENWLAGIACLVIEIHNEKGRALVESECSAYMERHLVRGENDLFLCGPRLGSKETLI